VPFLLNRAVEDCEIISFELLPPLLLPPRVPPPLPDVPPPPDDAAGEPLPVPPEGVDGSVDDGMLTVMSPL
jgi:hypothetical protein